MPTPGELTDNLLHLPDGSVIRWQLHGRFTYVAIKVRGQWYTTATESNNVVDQIINSHELAYVLYRENAQPAVEVVSTWQML